MRRRLFNLAAAVSLILCAATVVLWVRSYWVSEQFIRDLEIRGPAYWGLGSRSGSAAFVYLRESSDAWYEGSRVLKPRWRHQTRPAWTVRPGADDSGFIPQAGYMSFRAARELRPPDGQVVHVIVPYWCLVTLAVAPAALVSIDRRRSAHRVQSGRCIRCGYDLRATPERCPECGTVVESAAARAAADRVRAA